MQCAIALDCYNCPHFWIYPSLGVPLPDWLAFQLLSLEFICFSHHQEDSPELEEDPHRQLDRARGRLHRGPVGWADRPPGVPELLRLRFRQRQKLLWISWVVAAVWYNLCYYWCENRGCDTTFCYIINLLQLEVKVKYTNDVPTCPGFAEGICASLKCIFELF